MSAEGREENWRVHLGVANARGDEYQERYEQAKKQLDAVLGLLFEVCPLAQYAEITAEVEALGIDV